MESADVRSRGRRRSRESALWRYNCLRVPRVKGSSYSREIAGRATRSSVVHQRGHVSFLIVKSTELAPVGGHVFGRRVCAHIRVCVCAGAHVRVSVYVRVCVHLRVCV